MMSTISAFQSGLSGFQKGVNSLNQNAAKIARASTDPNGDITTPLVNMSADKRQAQASAKVIQTSNDMLGTLLDIKV